MRAVVVAIVADFVDVLSLSPTVWLPGAVFSEIALVAYFLLQGYDSRWTLLAHHGPDTRQPVWDAAVDCCSLAENVDVALVFERVSVLRSLPLDCS